MQWLHFTKKKKKKSLNILNVHDAKNNRTCDYMIRYASTLDTVLLFYDLADRS